MELKYRANFPSYGVRLTMDEFVSQSKARELTDWDGYGLAAIKGKVSLDLKLHPSEAGEMGDEIREVCWVSKEWEKRARWLWLNNGYPEHKKYPRKRAKLEEKAKGGKSETRWTLKEVGEEELDAIRRGFWLHVDKTPGLGPNGDCWLWTRGKSVTVPKRGAYVAARVSWWLEHGRDLGELFACHKCDTPLCVRPSHLFAGTQKDNMQDCIAKGRFNTRRKSDR